MIGSSDAWRNDRRWRDGVIRSGGPGGVIGLWIFTLIWSTAPTFLLLLQLGKIKGGHPPPWPFTAMFAAVGVLLLCSAIYRTMAFLRFGRSTLTLTPFPAHPGEPLRAAISLNVSLDDVENATAKLQSIRRTVSSGNKSTTTTDSVLWEDEQPASVDVEGAGTSLSATFSPPFDALPSDLSRCGTRHLWVIVVHAVRPGVDYRATFELPLLPRAPGDHSAIAQPVAKTANTEAKGLPIEELSQQRIRMQRDGVRSFTIYFPPARHVGAAITLTVFAAIFVGATVFLATRVHLTHGSGPMAAVDLFFDLIPGVMAVGFGLFSLLMVCITTSVWLSSTTVTVNRSGLTIVRSMLGIQRRRVIASEDIAGIVPKSTMTSGNDVYYAMKVTTRDGKSSIVGSGIANGHVAERLAAGMMETIGKQGG